jgi:hypothetical protein
MLDMGWTEIEETLLQASGSWFIDEKDPVQWETLINLVRKEFPEQSHENVRRVVLQARQSLLPPVANNRVVEWLKFALKEPPNFK